MSLIVSKILTTFFAIYFLLINSGISVSHIYCEYGQRYILGSEMPACSKKTPNNYCPYSKQPCKKNSKDNRKKDTVSLSFKFSADNNHANNTYLPDHIELIKINVNYGDYFDNKKTNQFLSFANNDKFKNYHPPPLISKPLLSKIQVFKI